MTRELITEAEREEEAIRDHDLDAEREALADELDRWGEDYAEKDREAEKTLAWVERTFKSHILELL